jgi:hypothetical protein
LQRAGAANTISIRKEKKLMTPTFFQVSRFVCSLIACLACVSNADVFATARPNIVVIFADDLGWQEPAYAGSDYCETPHLDRLAREGMVFRHAHASAANCQPSRACMLSG